MKPSLFRKIKCSYGKFKHDDVVTINTLNASLPLFGRYCDISFSFYHIHEENTTINFGMKASTNAGMGIEGTCKKMLVVPEPRRQLEQEIVIPHIMGNVLESSSLKDGGAEAANAVAEGIIDRTESIFETIRQSIRHNLAPQCRKQFLHLIDTRYHQYTASAAKQFLSNVNWPLLFDGVEVGKDFLETLDKFFINRSPRISSIWFENSDGIPTIKSNVSCPGLDCGRIADLKATVLLGQVCGQMAREEFKRFGTVSLSKDGYDFLLRPNTLPECTDPLGHKARLCVHTVNFSCNVIDEICIAWLSINHQLEKFIRSSNIFGSDFIPPWKLKKEKV